MNTRSAKHTAFPLVSHLASGLCLCAALAVAPGLLPAAEPAAPAPAVPAATAATEGEEASEFHFWPWLMKTDRLTGDWGGVRTKLEDKGFKFSLFYNQTYGWKNNGGAHMAYDDANSGSVDFFGQFDFQKMGLIPGGEALIQVKENWSWNINQDMVGKASSDAVFHPIDDADGQHPIYIDQLWYQQNSDDKKLQFRLGYLDQQVILDRNAYANNEDKQFMNTLLDNNSAIIPLIIGPGAALFYNPFDWLSFVWTASDRDALLFHSSLDTTFDGDINFMGFFEATFKVKTPLPWGPLPGNYRLGLLVDPRDKTSYSGTTTSGADEGFWLSFDQMVYAEPGKKSEGLGFFARYGCRQENVNRLSTFWSMGAQYQGLLPRRGNDVLGFGYYSAIGSDDYIEYQNPNFDRQNGYEAYYSIQLTPAFAVTPGGQYIVQPGGLTTRRDSWVFATRLRFSF